METSERQERFNKTRLNNITHINSSRESGEIPEHLYRDDLYKHDTLRPNGRELVLVAGFNDVCYQWNIHDGGWVEDRTTFCPDASQFAEIRRVFNEGKFELADSIARRYYEQADRIAALNIGLTRYL